MKYFIIAGEASGDLHGSGLIAQLRQIDTSATLCGMGGDKMKDAGCELVQHYQNMAFMGISAVLRNLDKVRDNFRIAKESLVAYQPDALILIDYPSFNLKVASFCKKHLPATKIFYYIPPKVWAWKRFRVHKIARLSDKILGIFPFEPSFYASYGYPASYVGNPTMDSVQNYKNQPAQPISHFAQPMIAILPGSRRHEIEKCLPLMLQAVRNIENHQIVIAGAPGIEHSFYDTFLQGEKVVFDSTYSILSSAAVAIVNSGTATLETALFHCPQVAVYHINCGKLLWKIRRLVFQIPYFTLVNILADKEVIKEYIGPLFTVENVRNEVYRLLSDSNYRNNMLQDYQRIETLLGNKNAATNAAQQIIGTLRSSY